MFHNLLRFVGGQGGLKEGRWVYMAKPERHAPSVSAAWATNALQNSLDRWGAEAKREKDAGHRQELEQKMITANRYLESIKRPVESPEDMDRALMEWDRLGALAGHLRQPGSEISGLVDILDSDFASFLDKPTHSQAVVARERIVQSEAVEDTLNPPSLKPMMEKGEASWVKTREELSEEAGKLANEDAKKWYRQAVAEHPEANKGEWVKKSVSQYQKILKFKEKIPLETLENLRALVAEAMGILQDRMAEHLEERTKEVESKVEKLIERHGKELAPETAKFLRIRIKNAKAYIQEKIRAFDASEMDESEAYKTLSERIRSFGIQADTSLREIGEMDSRLAQVEAHRPEMVSKLKKEDERVRAFMSGVNSPKGRKTAEVAIAFERGRVVPADRTVAGKRFEEMVSWSNGVENPKAEWKRDLSESVGLEGLRGEELLARMADVAPVANVLESSEKAQAATRALKAIESATSSEDMMAAVTDAVGAEHVEYVSSSVFEKKFRPYTSTGYMVFYQKGEQWKIIVDKEAVRQAQDASFLRGQLAHELRHLEFEGDLRINEAWKRTFLEKIDPLEWASIKRTYVEKFPDKAPTGAKRKKGPFKPEEWKDEDVLSELYAMRGEWASAFAGVLPALDHASRLADYGANEETRVAWENAFLNQVEPEEWLKVREAVEKALPNRGDAKGENVVNWEDRDIVAELYAMGKRGWEAHPELTTALTEAGLFAWLYGNESKAQNFAEHAEEKILGFEGGGMKGAKDKEAEEKEKGGGSLSKDGLEKDLNEIKEKISKYEESPMLSSFPGGAALLVDMRQFADELIGQLKGSPTEDELAKVNSGKGAIAEGLEGEEESVKSALKSIADKQNNPDRNALIAVWKATTIYAPRDFVAVFEHAKDYLQRWSKREAGIHKGWLSKLFFEGVNEGLALESSSFISGAWKDAVLGWEERLKSKDFKKLYDYLHEQAERPMPDKGVVLAIVNVLCDKGGMNWINEDLWSCLNRLQNETRFDYPEDHLLYEDQNYLREKLKKAFGAGPVYNKLSAFNDRDRSNESAYESKKKEYEPVIKRAPYLIGPRLTQLLMKRKGVNKSRADEKKFKGDKTVDAAEYEELLDLSIDHGLYEPELVIFYLISGMACGLLKPNTGVKLAKHFGAYPVMDWFNGMASAFRTQRDIRDFVEEKFESDYLNCKAGKSFMQLYWTEILNHGRVISRMTQKVESGGQNWDHDWSRAFAMAGDASIAQTILKGPSASPVTKLTQIPNIYAGLLQWFELNSEAKKPSKNLIIKRLGYYFMFETILSGAAFKDDKSYRRGSNIDKNQKPRESDMTNHPDWTVGQIEDKLNGAMQSLHPGLGRLFALAIDKQMADEQPQAHFQAMMALISALPLNGSQRQMMQKFTKSDDIYANIGSVVEWFLQGVSETALASALKGAVG